MTKVDKMGSYHQTSDNPVSTPQAAEDHSIVDTVQSFATTGALPLELYNYFFIAILLY